MQRLHFFVKISQPILHGCQDEPRLDKRCDEEMGGHAWRQASATRDIDDTESAAEDGCGPYGIYTSSKVLEAPQQVHCTESKPGCKDLQNCTIPARLHIVHQQFAKYHFLQYRCHDGRDNGDVLQCTGTKQVISDIDDFCGAPHIPGGHGHSQQPRQCGSCQSRCKAQETDKVQLLG